ncbi:hypothetical protein, partial [Psittacicella gerlachiana]
MKKTLLIFTLTMGIASLSQVSQAYTVYSDANTALRVAGSAYISQTLNRDLGYDQEGKNRFNRTHTVYFRPDLVFIKKINSDFMFRLDTRAYFYRKNWSYRYVRTLDDNNERQVNLNKSQRQWDMAYVDRFRVTLYFTGKGSLSFGRYTSFFGANTSSGGYASYFGLYDVGWLTNARTFLGYSTDKTVSYSSPTLFKKHRVALGLDLQ